jgi:hypothetical protein
MSRAPLGYWFGPYNVLVPNTIDKIVAEDGYNTLYKDGTESEIYRQDSLSKDEWLAKYASYNNQGRLMYTPPGYWFGPYNVLVPNTINKVVASDGYNILYKDGMETQTYFENGPSKEEWFVRYTKYDSEGQLVYKQ